MRLAVFVILFCLSLCCSAQNTVTVTGTVTDSDGQAWAGATWAWILSGGNDNTTYTDGTPVPKIVSGTLDATGSFVNATIPNNGKVNSEKSQAQFTICALTSAANTCQIVKMPVTTDGFDLGAAVSQRIQPPRINGTVLNYAYNTAEIKNPQQGSTYINTIDKTCSMFFNGGYIPCININNLTNTTPTPTTNTTPLTVSGKNQVQMSDATGKNLASAGISSPDDSASNRTFDGTHPQINMWGYGPANNFPCNTVSPFKAYTSNGYWNMQCIELDYTNGLSGFANGSNNLGLPASSTVAGIVSNVYDHGYGLASGISSNIVKTGGEDVQGYNNNVVTYGSVQASSGEGAELYRDIFGESGTTFSAVVSNVVSPTRILANGWITDGGNQGTGRYLRDITLGSLVSDDAVLTGVGPSAVGNSVTISASSAIDPSNFTTAVCSLDSNINTPEVQNGESTSMKFPVTCTGSVGPLTLTGIPVVNGIIWFSEPQHDQGKITAVTQDAPNHYQVTADIYRAHYAGGIIAQGKGAVALAFKVNTINGLVFGNECGIILDATHLTACGNFFTSSFIGFDAGNIIMSSMHTGWHMTNTNGIVRIGPRNFTAYDLPYLGKQVIISGADTQQFNNPCGNLRIDASDRNYLLCDQSASTGLSANVDSLITVMDKQLAIYPITMVRSVLNTSVNSIDGTLLIEPSGWKINAGDTVVQDHGYTAIMNPFHRDIGSINPSSREWTNAVSTLTIRGALGTTGLGQYWGKDLGNGRNDVYNAVPLNQLVGNGGSKMPLHGYRLFGPWFDGLVMEHAPYAGVGGALVIGCPYNLWGENYDCGGPHSDYAIVQNWYMSGGAWSSFRYDPYHRVYSFTATVAGFFRSQNISTGSSYNTDLAGKLVIKAGTLTSAVYNFDYPYAAIPLCTISPWNSLPSAVGGLGGYSAQASVSNISVVSTNPAQADVTFIYHCINQNGDN